MRPDRPAEQAPGTSARLIYFALIGGVVGFAVVAGVLTGWGERPGGAGAEAGFFPWVWAALALGSFPAILLFRNRARAAAGLDGERTARAREIDVAQVQTNLIVAWALTEGPALLGVVVFFLLGRLDILAWALLVAAIGWALAYPSREYFEARPGVRT